MLDPEHKRIALDSNVLIYLLEGQGRLAEAAAGIVDSIDSGDRDAVMSAIGLTEILAGPAIAGDAQAFELTAEALRDSRIEVVPLDGATAEDAAWIRGSIGVSLADSIHLATARNADATAFVTNDRRIRPIPRLSVVLLADLAGDTP
jgi:predicted nucleic acid-binding protein